MDKLFVILPFEKEFFHNHGISAYYFGHPLMHHIREFKADPEFRKKNKLDERPIIALLPGSRRQEILTMLKVFFRRLGKFPGVSVVIGGLEHHRQLYQDIIQNSHALQRDLSGHLQLLTVSTAALVTSGTATLETALFGVPKSFATKRNWISYQIAKRLIKVKFISLVNQIAGKNH
ncbi:MAG: hypothetical protein IPI90_12635 [Saprospiraceae bacterium]|nr:hypothetical protein [Candidatus Vicinibacter affinis]